MRMDIDKQYCITSNKLEITVNIKSKGKDKKTEEVYEVLTPIAHVNTLQSACKTLLNRAIRQSNAFNDIKQLRDDIEAMKTNIDKAFGLFDVDKLTKEFKKFDNVKFDTDDKDVTPESEEKPSKTDADENKEYDKTECGKPIF